MKKLSLRLLMVSCLLSSHCSVSPLGLEILIAGGIKWAIPVMTTSLCIWSEMRHRLRDEQGEEIKGEIKEMRSDLVEVKSNTRETKKTATRTEKKTDKLIVKLDGVDKKADKLRGDVEVLQTEVKEGFSKMATEESVSEFRNYSEERVNQLLDNDKKASGERARLGNGLEVVRTLATGWDGKFNTISAQLSEVQSAGSQYATREQVNSLMRREELIGTSQSKIENYIFGGHLAREIVTQLRHPDTLLAIEDSSSVDLDINSSVQSSRLDGFVDSITLTGNLVQSKLADNQDDTIVIVPSQLMEWVE